MALQNLCPPFSARLYLSISIIPFSSVWHFLCHIFVVFRSSFVVVSFCLRHIYHNYGMVNGYVIVLHHFSAGAWSSLHYCKLSAVCAGVTCNSLHRQVVTYLKASYLSPSGLWGSTGHATETQTCFPDQVKRKKTLVGALRVSTAPTSDSHPQRDHPKP